jgi:UDP-N-acetylenolpyruvoylglucosamine reductase
VPDHLDIKENVILAPMTTLGVGGPARFFTECRSENDVIETIKFGEIRGVEIFVLGGGSNLLVADAGFDGLVVKIDLRGKTLMGDGVVEVAAGEEWDEFVRSAVQDQLAGIECMSGIPGRVGGTPVQNVGAYGQEVSETIMKVRCLDRETKHIVELNNSECGFSYRRSIFNSESLGNYIVLSVTFNLTQGGDPQLKYKELIDHFTGFHPTLSEVREAILAIRRRKSMVIESGDPNSRSAGSFFKNPVVSAELYLAISDSTRTQIPKFPAVEGSVKIPAAWLIENSGFQKGFRLGNAGISSNHSLAIVNRGGASAAEIVDLMRTIQDGVKTKFGIDLYPEPVFLGF